MAVAPLSPLACYRALQAHDARFDGRFFVGVTSTGIYCRPICRARLPARRHCTFHATAAAAEAAGFRPCLRCRPELAPGVTAREASAALAHAAARMIDDGAADHERLTRLAERIGVSARHLRRMFADEFGVTPVHYAQTHRLLLAKRLLTDTALPPAVVAAASGFRSHKRMASSLTERYGLSPLRLRRAGGAARPGGDTLELSLAYRPPYDWAHLLAFFAKRAIPGVEDVTATTYRRVVRFAPTQGGAAAVTGWIEVDHRPERHALRLRLPDTLAVALQPLLVRCKRVFDTAAEPDLIAAALGPLAADAPGVRLPGAFDGFELALRAILGQQVTVQAARTLATRFVDAFGEAAATPFAALSRAFPQPARVARLARDDIARLGIVGARADAMIALARAVDDGTLTLVEGADPEATVRALCAVRGIGPWTAHYIAMRALAWPDAWPPKDVALLNALALANTGAGQRTADALAAAWRPWRSYAVLHLWRSLDASPPHR